MSDKYAESDSVLASKRMFTTAGVKFREYNVSGKTFELKL